MSSINIACNRDTALYGSWNTYNYGGSTLIYAGNGGSASYVYMSLLGFPSHGIPATAVVTNAYIKLYKNNLGSIGYSVNAITFRLCGVATNWTENTLNGSAGVTNYNGRPSRVEGIGQYADMSFATSNSMMNFGTNVWVNFPINSLMQNMVNGGTTYGYGFYFYSTTAATGNVRPFAARELDAGARTARLIVEYNDAPLSPTINFPVASTTIYNPTPRIGITSSTDSDGDTQLPWTNIGTPYANSTTNATWWSYPTMTNNTKRLLQWGVTLLNGTYTINTRSFDATLNSAMVTRSFTVATPSWTDYPINAGSSIPKAVHIFELRTYINNISSYYGINTRTWTDSSLVGINPKTCHIQEMRFQISEIISRVKAFDVDNTNGIILHSNGGFKYHYVGGTGDRYSFMDLTSVTDYTVQSGDYLYYDVYYDGTTAQQSGMDLALSNGQYLGDTAAIDQNGYAANCKTILNQPIKAWYSRKIELPAGWVGSSITKFDIATISNVATSTVYDTWFRNMYIADNADSLRKTIFTTTNGTASWSSDKISAFTSATLNFYCVPYGDYTNATIINGTTQVSAVHINELRNLIPTL